MDREVIANIKSLGIDMIEKANSGHPGIVLGAAPILYTLYAKHMNVRAEEPNWINRDRFVLSAGHGSALLYATLFMSGFSLTIDDLKNFRHIGVTPGHPEVGVTEGVDMSTGPLGQGFASAVGMALGEKILEHKYALPKKSKLGKNRSLLNYHVYALCGDGDLMEGISSEAASLAGSWKLNNLIVLYDSNQVSLDGPTPHVFDDNIVDRFEAMGWRCDVVKDGLSVGDIDKAITKAKEADKPSLIIVKTTIGYGSLLEGSNQAHGKVLSREDNEQLKVKLGVPLESFYVNEKAKEYMQKQIKERTSKKYGDWSSIYQEYVKDFLDGSNEKIEYLFGVKKEFRLPSDLSFDPELKEATRSTNGYIMNKIAPFLDNLVSGSADVSSSTKTAIEDSEAILPPEYTGKNINFGVREQAMGAIMNGLSLTYLRPCGSTFLAFSDYMKPAIRMSCLMNLPVTYIFTHDSIRVGEDGPTHQPIEQIAMLRSIPNLTVYRPADAHELVGCWETLLNMEGPSALILSRDEVELLHTTQAQYVNRGAYVVKKETNKLHAIIIATGTEVQTAYHIAHDLYDKYRLDIRVVSMPSMELFLNQPPEYQNVVLPPGYRNIVLEAGSSFGWEKFVYNSNYLLTINQFGVSGNKSEVLHALNYDYEELKARIEKLLL